MKKEKGPVQKWSVDTKDGFHEKVDKKELLKWGESLSQDDDTTDDFTVTDASQLWPPTKVGGLLQLVVSLID